jgi:hypothetical protein
MKISRDPKESAARRVEDAFAACKRRNGFAFWQGRRWWIEDSNKKIYAVEEAAPGCASGLDFTRVAAPFGRARRMKKRTVRKR